MEKTAKKTLPPLVARQQAALKALCQTHGVRRMALFGSVIRKDFDPDRSDLDLAVEFQPMSPADQARHYFELLESLRGLFDCPIDLVEITAVRNPYIATRIIGQQVSVYAA